MYNYHCLHFLCQGASWAGGQRCVWIAGRHVSRSPFFRVHFLVKGFGDVGLSHPGSPPPGPTGSRQGLVDWAGGGFINRSRSSRQHRSLSRCPWSGGLPQLGGLTKNRYAHKWNFISFFYFLFSSWFSPSKIFSRIRNESYWEEQKWRASPLTRGHWFFFQASQWFVLPIWQPLSTCTTP